MLWNHFNKRVPCLLHWQVLLTWNHLHLCRSINSNSSPAWHPLTCQDFLKYSRYQDTDRHLICSDPSPYWVVAGDGEIWLYFNFNSPVTLVFFNYKFLCIYHFYTLKGLCFITDNHICQIELKDLWPHTRLFFLECLWIILKTMILTWKTSDAYKKVYYGVQFSLVCILIY